jgi:cell division protein FtsZ
MDVSNNLFQPIIIEGKPTTVLPDNVAKIAVIGVGGGGCNMVNHMIREGIQKIDLIVSNTDLKALRTSEAPMKIQLGPILTNGYGTGMKPEVGRDSAIESYEKLKEALEGTDIVFIAAGLGGGTGTGAGAIVAKAAKELGALTVAVVTKPFSWEGKRRELLATIGLEELKKHTDSIIVIKNDKLKEMGTADMGVKEAFRMVDNILYQAVNGMCEVILKPTNSDINVDFADVKTIMQHRGMALMGIGKGKGENAAKDALENAIKSPLLDTVSIESAKGIMIHWTFNKNLSLFSITDIMENINASIDTNADIIFGTATDDTLAVDEVKITIIATGFEKLSEEKVTVDNLKNNTDEMQPIDIGNNPNYYDTPPFMRGYSIKYSIAVKCA